MTVGLLIWNRLHYLRATLESARRCLNLPGIEWIVIDNESTERGLREYLEGADWITKRITRAMPMTDAMNLLVEEASADTILIWPEDMQFITESDWIGDCVELLRDHPEIGSLLISPLRRSEIRGLLTWRRWHAYLLVGSAVKRGRIPERQRVMRSTSGFPVRTFGWTKPGIVGSGIPTLTRTDVWRQQGPWRSSRGTFKDSSAGGEEDMLLRYRESGLRLQRAISNIPLAADIVTDPTGTKAKVRGDRRYGKYFPPPDGDFYYRIYSKDEMAGYLSHDIPVPFEDIVEPLGFQLPIDEAGNLRKVSINTAIESPLD